MPRKKMLIFGSFGMLAYTVLVYFVFSGVDAKERIKHLCVRLGWDDLTPTMTSMEADRFMNRLMGCLRTQDLMWALDRLNAERSQETRSHRVLSPDDQDHDKYEAIEFYLHEWGEKKAAAHTRGSS